MRTVAPEIADPTNFGLLSLAGEAGIVAVSCGACGEAVSIWKPRVVVAWFEAASVARTRKV